MVLSPDGKPVEGNIKSATFCNETHKKRRNTVGFYPATMRPKRSVKTSRSVIFKPRISKVAIMRDITSEDEAIRLAEAVKSICDECFDIAILTVDYEVLTVTPRLITDEGE